MTSAQVDDLITSLKQGIWPVKKSPAYLVGLAATTLFMVLMPLLYVSLIGLMAWASWWHLTTNAGILLIHGGGSWGLVLKLFVYLGPILAGITMIFFMIKPLFARSSPGPKPRVLTTDEAPDFYRFVYAVADAVKAPRPVVIHVDPQVNASASFENGWSGMLRGRLVLTVGLPLLESLNTRELGGILAHEFGHFAQGAGMRLSFIVRTLCFWFQRIVQHRDGWDVALEKATDEADGRIAIFVYLARGFVWLSRRALWFIALSSNAVCMFLLREMEYDADLHEARVSGSTQFPLTAHRLRRLATSWQEGTRQTSLAWAAGSLPHNFYALVGTLEGDLSVDTDEALKQAVQTEKPSVWRTHPLDRDRNARALNSGDPGILTAELRCRDLLDDFDMLSSSASHEFYERQIGVRIGLEKLVSNDDILDRNREAEADQACVLRQFRDYCGFFLPLALNLEQDSEVALDPDTLGAEALSAEPSMTKASKAFDEALQKLGVAAAATLAVRAGYNVESSVLERSLESALKAVEGAGTQLRTEMGPLTARASWLLLRAKPLRPQLSGLLDAHQCLASCDKLAQNIHLAIVGLNLLVSKPDNGQSAREEAIRSSFTTIRENLELFRERVEGTLDPFLSAREPMTLASRLFAVDTPPVEEPNELNQFARHVMDQSGVLYGRILGKLARTLEDLEVQDGWARFIL